MTGLDDLTGLCQPKQFHDSMKPNTLMQENGGSGAVQITPKLVSFAKDS